MEPLTRFQEDVLADLLQSIHMRSTLYCRANMSAPWGFRVSHREVASFRGSHSTPLGDSLYPGGTLLSECRCRQRHELVQSTQRSRR